MASKHEHQRADRSAVCETPRTHGAALTSNHNGYADRLAAAARESAAVRESDWYADYLDQHAPASTPQED